MRDEHGPGVSVQAMTTWNEALFRALFEVAGHTDPVELSSLIIDDVTCQRIAGIETREEFERTCFEHVNASLVRHDCTTLDDAIRAEQSSAGWDSNDPRVPPFLVHLIASALAGVHLDGKPGGQKGITSRNRFRDKLAEFLESHRDNADLAHLAQAWETLKRWIDHRASHTRCHRLELPDPGSMCRIGYSRLLVVPSRRDAIRLARLLDRGEHFDEDWPVHEIERFIKKHQTKLLGLHENLREVFDEFGAEVRAGLPASKTRAGRILRQISGHDLDFAREHERLPRAMLQGMWQNDAKEPLTLFMMLDQVCEPKGSWKTVEMDELGWMGFDHLVLARQKGSTSEKCRLFITDFLKADPGLSIQGHVHLGPHLKKSWHKGMFVFAQDTTYPGRYLFNIEELEHASYVRLMVKSSKAKLLATEIEETLGCASVKVHSSTIQGWKTLRFSSGRELLEVAQRVPTLFWICKENQESSPLPIVFKDGIGAGGQWLGHEEVLPSILITRECERVVLEGLGPDGDEIRLEPVPEQPTSLAKWSQGDLEGRFRVRAETKDGECYMRDLSLVRPLTDTSYRAPSSEAKWWTEALLTDGGNLDEARRGDLISCPEASLEEFSAPGKVSHTSPPPSQRPFWRLVARWQFAASRRAGLRFPEVLGAIQDVLKIENIGTCFELLAAWSAQLALDWCHSRVWQEQRIFLRRPTFHVFRANKGLERATLLGWVPWLLRERIRHEAQRRGLTCRCSSSPHPYVPGPLILEAREPTLELRPQLVHLSRAHGLAPELVKVPRLERLPGVETVRETHEFDAKAALQRLERYECYRRFCFEQWREIEVPEEPSDPEAVVATRWRALRDRGGGADVWLVHRADRPPTGPGHESDVIFSTHSRTWALLMAWHERTKRGRGEASPYVCRDGTLQARPSTRMPLPRGWLASCVVRGDRVPGPSLAPNAPPHGEIEAWRISLPSKDILDRLSSAFPSLVAQEDPEDTSRQNMKMNDEPTETEKAWKLPSKAKSYPHMARMIEEHDLGQFPDRARRYLSPKRLERENGKAANYVRDHARALVSMMTSAIQKAGGPQLRAEHLEDVAALLQPNLWELTAAIHAAKISKFGDIEEYSLDEYVIAKNASVEVGKQKLYLRLPEKMTDLHEEASLASIPERLTTYLLCDLDGSPVDDEQLDLALSGAWEDSLLEAPETTQNLSERNARVLRALAAVRKRDWVHLETLLRDRVRENGRVYFDKWALYSPAWRLFWAWCAWARHDWKSFWDRLLKSGSPEFLHSTLPLELAKAAWARAGFDPEEFCDIGPISSPKSRMDAWRAVQRKWEECPSVAAPSPPISPSSLERDISASTASSTTDKAMTPSTLDRLESLEAIRDELEDVDLHELIDTLHAQRLWDIKKRLEIAVETIEFFGEDVDQMQAPVDLSPPEFGEGLTQWRTWLGMIAEQGKVKSRWEGVARALADLRIVEVKPHVRAPLLQTAQQASSAIMTWLDATEEFPEWVGPEDPRAWVRQSREIYQKGSFDEDALPDELLSWMHFQNVDPKYLEWDA